MPLPYKGPFNSRTSYSRARTLYFRNRKISAARRIQRAFRRSRKPSKTFRRKVNSVALARDPVQYRLFSTNDTSATPDTPFIGISQSPIVLLNLSDLKFNNENSNLKYCRTSPKIKVMNMLLRMTFLAQDQPYGRVSVALVRHKRSEPIVNADIQSGLGARTTEDNLPFLPSSTATNNNSFPNDLGHNMTGTNPSANPFVLNNMGWNPKVVQVVKTWDITLQPQWRAIGGGATATSYLAGNTYPMIRDIEWNHKFNEIWKYENRTSANNLTESFFPYNNRCYSLIAFSDSIAGSAHPALSASVRLSFKDLD